MRRVYLILISLVIVNTSLFPNLKIVVRYDDFRMISNPIDKKIISIFASRNIPLVLGVIPFDKNEKIVSDNVFDDYYNLSKLIKSDKIEVAIHGYNHEKLSFKGEFGELRKTEQQRRIFASKHALDSIFDIQTVTFIPPWNSTDETTEKILLENGILCFSSSMYDLRESLCQFPANMSNIAQALEFADNNFVMNGVIILMLHAYDFKDIEKLKELEKDLVKLSENPKVEFLLFKDLMKVNKGISLFQIEELKRPNLLMKMVNKENVFLDTGYVVTIKIVNLLIYLAFSYAVSAMLGLLLYKLKYGKRYRHLTLIISILTAFIVWFRIFTPIKTFLILAFLILIIMMLMNVRRKIRFFK